MRSRPYSASRRRNVSSGPTLRIAKSVPDELAQRNAALIVRGMRLVDEGRLLLEQGREMTGARGLVERDVLVAELDAGLDHDGDDAREGVRKSAAAKDIAMNIERRAGRLQAGRLDLRNRMMRAAGRRNFRADDIERRRDARFRGGAFRPAREPRRAPGDRGVAKRVGLSGAAHRGVEMELAKSGARVGVDHRLGLVHRQSALSLRHGLGPR